MIAAIGRRIPFGLGLGLILALAATGCGGFRYQGEWAGEHETKAQPGEDPAIINTLRRVTLKIDGNRFELVQFGMPSTGNLRMADGRAYLVTKTRLNREVEPDPPAEQPYLEPMDRDTIRLVDPAGIRSTGATLRRAPAPN